MNMLTGVPAANCPYCTKPLGRWADEQLVHRCAACDRPLGRVRVSRSVRLYRIMPMLDVTKILGTVLALSGMVLMVVDPALVKGFVLLIAFALMTYGLTDVFDGWLSVRTRIDRTARKMRTGAAARRAGLAKILFGFLTLTVAIMGIVVRSSLGATV
jgi:hypothetical protein